MSEQTNPFFPVLRQPLFTDFVIADTIVEKVSVERDALLNGDNGKCLGVVSDVYRLIENSEVDRIFGMAFSDLPISHTVDHLNYKENRWQRDFILDGDQFNIVIGGDVVQTKVSIWNGYDGKSSVGFSISAYRQRHNLTFLSKMFGESYSHVQDGLVERIREDFAAKLQQFQNMTSLFESWNRQAFNRQSFENFVRGFIKTDDNDNNGYLGERQAEAIIDSYELHLSRCGVGHTRWGAYNVLASFAQNDINSRGDSSNIFTAGYKRMERLSQDFFELDVEADLFVI